MNQQKFEQIFEKLAFRRKEVLYKVLAGEADAAIAKAMDIGEATVRKHIERICQEFGLENEHSDERRCKRIDLVALFAKYKPELLRERTFMTTKEKVSTETTETTETKNKNEQQKIFYKKPLSAKLSENNPDESENLFSLESYSISPALEEHLEKQFQVSSDKEEKIQTAKSLNKIGHKYYLDGNFQSAVFYFKWALKFKRDFGVAYYNLGAAYEKLEDLLTARRCYRSAIKSSAIKSDERVTSVAINNLARLEILDGNSIAAVDMIERILSMVQDVAVKASLHKNLGWAYFEQKLYQKAKEHLLKSLELDSKRALTYCLLAKTQETQGETQNALKSWENCLKYDPNDQQPKGLDWKLPELHILKLEARRALNDKSNSRE